MPPDPPRIRRPLWPLVDTVCYSIQICCVLHFSLKPRHIIVACGLEDIGSQLEFQRLVKEHTCHDEVNRSTVILTSTSSQSSDSFKSRSSHDSVKPSRNALRNMVPLDARIYKAKYVSYAFIF